MNVPNLSEEIALAWQAFDHAATPPRVQPSAPILSFGDLEAYRASPLRVLTVGLNPSRNEFPDEEPFKRFPLLDGSSQDRDPGRYISALSSYFETEPYSSWFGAFEPLLNGLGSSFYQKSSTSARALHTDLCSPVATAPTWSDLDEANRKSLEADGIPLWHKLLEKLQPQVVLLSVAQHYLEHIQFEPLTDWETIHTFTETANGDPRAQPYPILVRWYKVGDQVSMFAWGEAAQTPFGLLANTHKQEAGERLLDQYQQGGPIMRRFIQFPHPGPEHEPDDPNGKVKSWSERHDLHGRDLDHKRKFMRLRGGEWIDREGHKHKGDLDAWGEWEPESNVISRFNPEDDQLPKYLWELYWIRKKHHTDLHNTDPFIFGSCFLFSNCKQRKHGNKTALQNLAPGSLIIFGSRKGGTWILDTVFVVGEKSISYDPQDPHAALGGEVSDTFLHVTGDPLAAEGNNVGLRLYFGATPDNPINGIFSFFPAKPAGANSSFRRPAIQLPEKYCTPSLAQSWKGTDCSPEELRELWDSIVQQVYDAGLVLGTHADLPPPNCPRPTAHGAGDDDGLHEVSLGAIWSDWERLIPADQLVVLCGFDLLASYGLPRQVVPTSISEARHLIQGGGVRLDRERITDPHRPLIKEELEGKVLQLGEGIFCRLVA